MAAGRVSACSLEAKHPFARQAAETSEAAGAQGQCWCMHDGLFEDQDALDEESLKDYAVSLGLGRPRFKPGGSQSPIWKRADRDITSGRRRGVLGTSTFFVNGTLHTDEDTLERLAVRMMEH